MKQGAGKGQRKCGRKEYAFFVLPENWKQKKHFILECEAFKDNRESYADTLAVSSWDNLFNEGFVEKMGAFIVKLHKKKSRIHQADEEAICPICYL